VIDRIEKNGNEIQRPATKELGRVERVAKNTSKIIQPAIKALETLGVAVFIFLVLMLIYSVIARKVFTPMKGALELSEFSMMLITFFFLPINYLKADQMVMDTFVEKVRGVPRKIIQSFVHLCGFAILGVLSWRLFVYASKVQGMGQESVVLALPTFVFIYIAAFCCTVLTLVYLLHFMNSLVAVQKARRR
jgi:TRAP-type C4-dicarboxylate transport system permease small subunit